MVNIVEVLTEYYSLIVFIFLNMFIIFQKQRDKNKRRAQERTI